MLVNYIIQSVCVPPFFSLSSIPPMVSVRLPTSLSCPMCCFRYTFTRKTERSFPSLTIFSPPGSSNAHVPTNINFHSKRHNSFSPLLVSLAAGYRLRKIGSDIASLQGAYATPECEVRCLEKCELEGNGRSSPKTPPLIVIFVELERHSAHAEQMMNVVDTHTHLHSELDWWYS